MIRSIEKYNDLIGIQTRDLPACSIVPQPTTLPRAPAIITFSFVVVYFAMLSVMDLEHKDQKGGITDK
jgi:hypothetical protein